MFISVTFRATSIDETNKTQQKVRGLNCMFKMSTIHANDYATAHVATAMTVCMVQQPPLSQQTFFQLSTFFQLTSRIHER